MAGKWDDDEYVASLLKQDAKKAAKTYELVGIDAFSHKKRAGAPKPNTNFLRHIIRQTDSHNAALLAKEADESKARFREMNRNTERRSRDHNPRDRTHGRLSTISSDNDGNRRPSRRRSKYGEDEDGYAAASTGKKRESGHNTRKDTSREHGRHKRRHDSSDEDRHARKRRREYVRDEADDRARRKRRREHRRRRDKSPFKSPSVPRSHRSSRPKRENLRQDRFSAHQRTSRKSRSRSLSSAYSNDLRKPYQRSPSLHSDSDPLESLVGPLPPPDKSAVQARGRGAQKANATNIDSRFSTNYDPNTDVRLDSDVEDDWGDALEALRDRQRWKQQGASRLKAAGFTDSQIKKWEAGTDPGEDDVVWTGKGQAREWDRGKVVGDDGHIELKADFGQLK